MKYYKPHLEKHFAAADGSDLKDKLTDEDLKVMTQVSEGAYTFKPEFEDGHNQYTYSYSQLDQDVHFQGGKYMDQYTILLNNKSKDQALVKVRFSPAVFEQIIEFEVELNAVSLSPNFRGKDITVNW